MRFLLVFMFIPITANAGLLDWHDDWSTTDDILLGAYSYYLVMDYTQTVDSVINRGWIEENNILGENPSRNEIDTYFILKSVFDITITNHLEGTWRKLYIIAVTYDLFMCSYSRRGTFNMEIVRIDF